MADVPPYALFRDQSKTSNSRWLIVILPLPGSINTSELKSFCGDLCRSFDLLRHFLNLVIKHLLLVVVVQRVGVPAPALHFFNLRNIARA